MAKKDKMTVDKYVDKMVSMKTQGKSDMEITAFCIRHLAFTIKYRLAIEMEIKQRLENEEREKREGFVEISNELIKDCQ